MSLRAVEWKLNMEAYRFKKSQQQNEESSIKTEKEVIQEFYFKYSDFN
jgi:hypothetical protein